MRHLKTTACKILPILSPFSDAAQTPFGRNQRTMQKKPLLTSLFLCVMFNNCRGLTIKAELTMQHQVHKPKEEGGVNAEVRFFNQDP